MVGVKTKPYLLSVLALSVVFTADILIPLGYTHWVFYIIPLLISFKAENVYVVYFTLVLTALLLLIGYFLSPTIGVFVSVTIINRILGFFTLVIFSLIITALIASQRKIREASENVTHSNKELALANKELESLSYSLSHDLRNPLHAIKGFSDILLSDSSADLDCEGVEYLRRIVATAAQMDQLIDSMLTLFKISSQELNINEVDLGKMAQEIMTQLQKSHPQRGIELRIVGALRAMADSELIKIALNNLLGNAWKYTSHKDNARIEVGAENREGKTIFYVRDNGAGFDMKYESRLFEPFRRLHSDKEFSGTGIGLAIVRRVILKHGGDVWGKGKIGEGAVFYFTLS